jgi:hypothetical protein
MGIDHWRFHVASPTTLQGELTKDQQHGTRLYHNAGRPGLANATPPCSRMTNGTSTSRGGSAASGWSEGVV